MTKFAEEVFLAGYKAGRLSARRQAMVPDGAFRTDENEQELALSVFRSANHPCKHPGCGRFDTGLVAQHQGVKKAPLGADWYCPVHGDKIVNEKDPELEVTCPNCACRFGAG